MHYPRLRSTAYFGSIGLGRSWSIACPTPAALLGDERTGRGRMGLLLMLLLAALAAVVVSELLP